MVTSARIAEVVIDAAEEPEDGVDVAEERGDEERLGLVLVQEPVLVHGPIVVDADARLGFSGGVVGAARTPRRCRAPGSVGRWP